ncbi:hypothetical protein [Parasitella parasitica]|uniref:Uncharacterized protein n=1 Tax=Parasitella parasitica TaxID=35722 RepID=A0A0B7NVX8_9FUNG|nr:hypothetical protein [Parasitella parasitica]
MNANLDQRYTNSENGAYAFWIHGSIHHLLSSTLIPESDSRQIYIFDSDNELRNRMNVTGNPDVNSATMLNLQTMMHEVNPSVALLKTMEELSAEQPGGISDIRMIFRAEGTPDARRYNSPSAVDYTHQSVNQFRKEVLGDRTNNRGRSSFSNHADNSGSQSSSSSHVDKSPSQSSSPSHIDNDGAIQDESSVHVNTRTPDTTIRLTKNSKTYSFKPPVSCLTMPHTPKIQERDSRAILKNCALGIESLINKSEYTNTDEMKELKTNQKQQRDNMSLSKICGIMDFLRDALNYEFNELLAALWTHPILDSSDSTARHFASIIAYTLTDFHCNCKQPMNFTNNHERTPFVEFIVPMFKYLAKQTNLLGFSWCEKLVETQKYAQIEEVNFVIADVDKKYADGLGKLQNHESLFIESSSGITQENVNTLEDTLKLICECNGALFYILSQFNKCSFETALRRSTFGVQVIKNTLTLSKMNLKNATQWKFVELRSAIVPTKWDDRFEWVAMFELMASLYLKLIEQEQVIMDIKKENSGLEYVAAKDTFSARLNMH